MPFIDIRLAGAATREQKAGIVADVTASMVARLGKSAAAVQVNITELSLDNYGAAGILLADRAADGVMNGANNGANNGEGAEHATPQR